MSDADAYRRHMMARLADEHRWACGHRDMSEAQYVTWLLDLVGEHIGQLACCTGRGTVLLAFAERVGGPGATTP